MEAGMMKVVFSSSLNGRSGDLPANEAKRSNLDIIGKIDGFKHEIRYNLPEINHDNIEGKSLQSVIISPVNASSCANLQTEKALDGYLTFTTENAFLQKCL